MNPFLSLQIKFQINLCAEKNAPILCKNIFIRFISINKLRLWINFSIFLMSKSRWWEFSFFIFLFDVRFTRSTPNTYFRFTNNKAYFILYSFFFALTLKHWWILCNAAFVGNSHLYRWTIKLKNENVRYAANSEVAIIFPAPWTIICLLIITISRLRFFFKKIIFFCKLKYNNFGENEEHALLV